MREGGHRYHTQEAESGRFKFEVTLHYMLKDISPKQKQK